MSPNDERLWERSRQYVPNKRVSMLRLLRWRKMRRTKRNRKSLLAYWWAPVAVTLTMAAGIFFAAMGLPEGNLREGESLPEPGLYVVYTTQEMMTRLVRAENVRRIALALNDDEVGISLKAILPEPPLYRAQTLESQDYYALPVSEKHLSVEGFLPPMAEEVMAYPAQYAVKWLPDAALSASGFKVELPSPGADVRETSAGNLREGESLPEPGLYVVYTTQEMMTRLVRAENVRRIALALNDDEVGISLKAILPEPPLYRAQTLESQDYYALPVSEKHLSVEGFLPPMAEEVMAYPAQYAVKWLPDAALSASGFKVELPSPGADVRETSARFGVRLNAAGHVVDVLRLAPAGRETAWLRQLRMALLKGRGTNAAQGVIRIYWNAEGEE